MTKERAFVFIHKTAVGNFPVSFDNHNVWHDEDYYADATFFSSEAEAKKKQKYATSCDIVEVRLTIEM